MILTEYKKINKNIKNKGYYVIRNLFNKEEIKNLKFQILKLLNNNNNFHPVKDIAFYKNQLGGGELLKSSNGSLTKNLKKNLTNQGISKLKNLTNSISIKDPLIKVKKLYRLVYDERLSKIAKLLFNNNNISLGYIKLGVFFNNSLPKNCINYFHTDDLNKNDKKNNQAYKFSICLDNFKKKKKSEFGIITKKKSKIKFYKQYFSKEELPKFLKKKIIYPSISSGDAILFDPNNFFHVANKPKKGLRIILYVEFLLDRNKKVFNKVKINKNTYQMLNNYQKHLSKNFLKI